MNRRILRLAIPNIISNVTVPLLGMVDLALMGHLHDKVFIGAVALGSMIFNFIYWGFGFLRMSTSGFVAQEFGRRDFTQVMLNLARPLTLALLAGLLLVLLQVPVASLAFWLVDSGPEVETYAREYFHIRIYAAPATIGLYAIAGWFIGMQNTRLPMIIAVSVNLLNIVLSYTLVRGFGMLSAGVAFGTLVAQYMGFILALIMLYRYYSRFFRFYEKRLFWERFALGRFFSVNRDILIRTLCLIFALSFFTARSAAMGDTLLAVNSMLLQFFMFFSYLVDGYAHAAEALTGRYVGSGNRIALRNAIRYLFLWGGGIAVVFTAAYLVWGFPILTLLTSNTEVLSGAAPYLFWTVLIPVVSFPAFIWDGIFIGATASGHMRNAMLVSTLLVYFPVYYLSLPYLGNNALWLALLLFLLSRGVSIWLMSPMAIFKNKT